MKITLNDTFQGIAICAIVLIAFSYLDMEESSTPPGWTSPVRVQEQIDLKSLVFHNGKLWLVSIRGPSQEEEVIVSHSDDGVTWSSPYVFLKKSPENDIGFREFQWLKRPNGDLWLVWSSWSRMYPSMETIYFAELEESGTLGTPQEGYSHNKKGIDFCSIANTPDGGLIIMMDYYKGISSSECLILLADENMEWDSPTILSESTYLSAEHVYLDNEGTIWAMYRESTPIDGTFFQTSEDGISWSEPYKIVDESPLFSTFIQRHDGQYMLFAIDYDGFHTASVLTSSDGIEWSQPDSLFKMEEPCGILSFDIGEIPLWGPAYVVAAESDEGTVWALIETHCEIFSMQFTDQQYSRDLQAIRNCQVKNGAIACGIGIVTGVGWVALRKKL